MAWLAPLNAAATAVSSIDVSTRLIMASTRLKPCLRNRVERVLRRMALLAVGSHYQKARLINLLRVMQDLDRHPRRRQGDAVGANGSQTRRVHRLDGHRLGPVAVARDRMPRDIQRRVVYVAVHVPQIRVVQWATG